MAEVPWSPCAWYYESYLPENSILRLVRHLCVNCGSSADSHLEPLERKVHSLERLCQDLGFLSLTPHCHAAGLCVLYKVYSNSNHCLFSKLPSVSTRVWYTRAAVAAHKLELEVSKCRTSQFARYFLSAQVHMWDDQYTVFDTELWTGFRKPFNSSQAQRSVSSCLSWRRCLWGSECNLWIILFFPLDHVPDFKIKIIIKFIWTYIYV